MDDPVFVAINPEGVFVIDLDDVVGVIRLCKLSYISKWKKRVLYGQVKKDLFCRQCILPIKLFAIAGSWLRAQLPATNLYD